jgi:hypothetical protein
VAKEVFDDALGLSPQFAYMASSITLNSAVSWGLWEGYNYFAETPTATINTNPTKDFSDPKYSEFLKNAGESGDAGRTVADVLKEGGKGYEILDQQGNLIGIKAVDGATTFAGSPKVGINHVAVVIRDPAGHFYNSMLGFEKGNFWLINGTCHQWSNQAILQAGYGLTVNTSSSGWFSDVTASTYGPYGSAEPALSYFEADRNRQR